MCEVEASLSRLPAKLLRVLNSLREPFANLYVFPPRCPILLPSDDEEKALQKANRHQIAQELYEADIAWGKKTCTHSYILERINQALEDDACWPLGDRAEQQFSKEFVDDLLLRDDPTFPLYAPRSDCLSSKLGSGTESSATASDSGPRKRFRVDHS